MDPVHIFPPTRRCCSSCSLLGPPERFQRCSRCKVQVYCSRECQQDHWKRGHKKSCRAQEIPPPSITEQLLPLDANEDALDVGYKYIIVRPLPPRPSLAAFVDSAEGTNEDSELDILVGVASGDKEASIDLLKRKYSWSSAPALMVVPGFREGYDGCRLVSIADFQTTTLPENNAAGYIMMSPLEKTRGVFVFACIDCAGVGIEEDEDIGDESPLQILPITRREILSIANYHNICGLQNAVSERIHYENISRNEALNVLRREKYVVQEDPIC